MKIEIQKGYIVNTKYDTSTTPPTRIDEYGLFIYNNSTGKFEYQAQGSPDLTWIDITEYLEDSDSFDINFKYDEIGLQTRDKGSSNDITIVGEGFSIIKAWMLEKPELQINFFNVRLTDEINNIVYVNYVIKADNISYDYLKGCEITLPLRESDVITDILDSTYINDNWQGWFGEYKFIEGGAIQPQKKVASLIHTYKVEGMVNGMSIGVNMALSYMVGLINSPFSRISTVVNTIKIFPIIGDLVSEIFSPIDLINNALEEVKNGLLESIGDDIGAGNYLPALKVNQILENGLSKFGYQVDVSNTINFNEILDSYVIQPMGGLYYKAEDSRLGDEILDILNFPSGHTTIINPYTGNVETPDNGFYRFLTGNFSTITMKQFIEEICKITSSEYFLDEDSKTLIFKSVVKSEITINNTQEDLLEFKKDFSELRKQAGATFEYTSDNYDSKSNDVRILYDGSTTTDINKNMSNNRDEFSSKSKINSTDSFKKIQSIFSPIGFWGDGFGNNYLEDMIKSGKTFIIMIAVMGLVSGIGTLTSSIGIVGGLGVGVTPTAVGGGAYAPAGIFFGILVAGISVHLLLNLIIEGFGTVRDNFGYDSSKNKRFNSLQINGDGRKERISLMNRDFNNSINTNSNNLNSLFTGARYGWGLSGNTYRFRNYYYHFTSFISNDKYIYKKVLLQKYGNININGINGNAYVQKFDENITIVLPLCEEFLKALKVNSKSELKINEIIKFNFDGKTYALEVKEFSVSYGSKEITIKGLLKYVI
jgi:hypothetical protein